MAGLQPWSNSGSRSRLPAADGGIRSAVGEQPRHQLLSVGWHDNAEFSRSGHAGSAISQLVTVVAPDLGHKEAALAGRDVAGRPEHRGAAAASAGVEARPVALAAGGGWARYA